MGKTNKSSEKSHKLSSSSIDRLSALPDDVICHILSFLPTQVSVSTSVIAKRWRFLWAHVPNIELVKDYRKKSVPETSFLDIIKVMSLYKVESMNTLRIHVFFHEEDKIEACIRNAIARHVRNLHLSYWINSSSPRCIFTCKTLVDLRLENCMIHKIRDASVGLKACEIRKSGDVCLPALKKLHLESVAVESLSRLLSGCPVLEELIVDGPQVYYGHTPCCCIASPTIKRLVLSSTCNYGTRLVPNEYTMTSLVEAIIVLNCDNPREDNILYSDTVIEFVGRLRYVKRLKLSTSCMEAPDSTFAAFSINFHNLTKLELTSDWRLLFTLIQNAVNLEVLIVRKVGEDLKCWIEPLQVPKCLLSHLRRVRIDHLRCTEPEFEFVRYLLRNAEILERMEINAQHNRTAYTERIDVHKRISSFQRGSKACQLVVCGLRFVRVVLDKSISNS